MIIKRIFDVSFEIIRKKILLFKISHNYDLAMISIIWIIFNNLSKEKKKKKRKKKQNQKRQKMSRRRNLALAQGKHELFSLRSFFFCIFFYLLLSNPRLAFLSLFVSRGACHPLSSLFSHVVKARARARAPKAVWTKSFCIVSFTARCLSRGLSSLFRA